MEVSGWQTVATGGCGAVMAETLVERACIAAVKSWIISGGGFIGGGGSVIGGGAAVGGGSVGGCEVVLGGLVVDDLVVTIDRKAADTKLLEPTEYQNLIHMIGGELSFFRF